MVGGYCVPAVALAVSWYIIIVIVCTAACSGYGEDAITSYCLSFIKTIVSLQILKQKTATKKRTPFTFQKGSFCIPKGVVLHSKRSPFTTQKDSFWKTKGKRPKYTLLYIYANKHYIYANKHLYKQSSIISMQASIIYIQNSESLQEA